MADRVIYSSLFIDNEGEFVPLLAHDNLNGTWSLDTNGVLGGAVPAGDNNIGNVDVLSIAAGTNNIGDVDIASIADGVNVVEGITTGAAVVTDANGTLQQYLRGLVKMAADTTPVATKGVGFSIPVTLTVTNGVYTIGDVVGGLITFANAVSAAGKRSIIHTIVLSGVAALDYELWFFDSNITTPAADNAVFALVAADVAMCKGVIPIGSWDYKAPASAFNVATLRGLAFEYSCAVTTLYAYLKAVTVTSPGTTTLTLTIKGEYID
jgi:hypothetical protein